MSSNHPMSNICKGPRMLENDRWTVKDKRTGLYKSVVGYKITKPVSINIDNITYTEPKELEVVE